MKTKNETKNNAKVEAPVAKAKRERKSYLFFLYVPERGFIGAGDNGMPVVGSGNPTHFSHRNKAMYAIEFFKTLKIADEILLVRNVG